MTEKISRFITDTLIEAEQIPTKQRDIYIYSISSILENLLLILYSIALGLVTHHFLQICILISVIYVLRRFCGGYHAPNAFLCTLLSYSIPLFFLLFSHILLFAPLIVSFLIFFSSVFMIWTLSPVDTPRRHFSDNLYRRLKYSSRVCLLFLSLILIFFFIFHQVHVIIAMAVSVAIAALSIFAGWVSNITLAKKETDHEI